MSDFTFHDVSYAQGEYNMDADPNPVIAMKMSGFYYGSKTSYYDVQAARNYNNAIRTGKLPMLYHFAGGADPIAEADFFVGACSPLAENDVLVLDYELTGSMNPPGDPVAWCNAFADRVHERTGVWVIFYTYRSLLNSYDFSSLLQKCGLWVADYSISPDGDVPTNGHNYIMHQYQGSPLDTSASYISVDVLKKYGYHAAVPAPIPTPTPPAPEPTPTPEPTPPPIPVPDPVPIPTPEPTPVPEPTPTPLPQQSLFELIKQWVSKLIDFLKVWKR